MPRALAFCSLCACAVVLMDACGAMGAESPLSGAHGDSVRKEVSRLLAELDSEQYSVRRQAATRLAELVEQPELGEALAVELHRVLIQADVSFEVRWQLERFAAKLPPPPRDPPTAVAPEELDRVLGQLDDDSYAVRLGAGRRLEWLLGHPHNAVPMLVHIKRRLADRELSDATRRQLERALDVARGAWLASDPAKWDLPEIGRLQIVGWVDEVAALRGSEGGSAGRSGLHLAEQELRDVLARDEYVPLLKELIEARLERGGLDPAARAALRRLADLTRPAMVAEYWTDGRHEGEQHLLVGVPSMTERSIRPSHFDRIDDETAHCISGSNLSPGDYPVGVAIPHPNQESAFFHLVNLPNPRRRMAYTYQSKTDDAVRLRALSRRTLDRFLKEKIPLDEAELVMLAQLDAEEVSRFAPEYFFAVEDEQLPPSGRRRLGGRPSRFGMLCGELAVRGTREAVPGLVRAIDQGRFLPPTSLAPYRMHWLAALAIALRDPWPEVDDWLAETVRRDVILMEGNADGPQLGATGAAVLLERHDRQPSSFDLKPAPAAELLRLAIDGYRFSGEEARKNVLDWWQGEKDRKKPL